MCVCAVCFQLQYWGERQKQDTASAIRTVGNKTSVLIRDLEGSSTYYISLRAYNSAGVGPQSSIVNVTTKKPRKDSHHILETDCVFCALFFHSLVFLPLAKGVWSPWHIFCFTN